MKDQKDLYAAYNAGSNGIIRPGLKMRAQIILYGLKWRIQSIIIRPKIKALRDLDGPYTDSYGPQQPPGHRKIVTQTSLYNLKMKDQTELHRLKCKLKWIYTAGPENESSKKLIRPKMKAQTDWYDLR